MLLYAQISCQDLKFCLQVSLDTTIKNDPYEDSLMNNMILQNLIRSKKKLSLLALN